MLNKRGQGLSTSSIILIILGLIILVVLALGFIMGWDKFSALFGGGDNNVDTIMQACSLACGQASQYDFCQNPIRRLEVSGNEYLATCYTLASADEFSEYGFEACSTLNCRANVGCEDWTYTKDGDVRNVVIGGGDVTAEPNAQYCA